MFKIFENFKRDTRGNVAMMFGIMTTVLIAGAGIAIDGSRLLSLRSNLQGISDIAALAGASVANVDGSNREQVVQEAVEFHLASINSTVTIDDIRIVFDDATETVSVTIDTQQELFFADFLGASMGDVSAVASASYALDNVQPVSIAMVLDVSGSMGNPTTGGQTKLETLQRASRELFDAIEEESVNSENIDEYIRTGMTAYNIDIRPEFTVPMTQGRQAVLNQIQTLSAAGSTDSSGAFALAYNNLIDDEVQEAGLRQYIVFMTDGNNKNTEDGTTADEKDAATLAVCDLAKSTNVRIFTVAFEAGERGQALLQNCASAPQVENYFDASNAAEFRAAFRKIGAEIAELNTRLTN